MRSMARFWDARAREDAWYFVDDRLEYRQPDEDRFWRHGERDLEVLLDTAGVAVEPGDVVVDLGCGLGRLTRVLARTAAHVHSIDVSPEMLRRAKELNAQLDNVTWSVGSGADLQPVADASVDAVVSHVVFQHIPDPAITLGYVREMGRVLRPGGWAAFQVSDDPATHTARARGPMRRARELLRLAPRGQRGAAWVGSSVDLAALRETADAAGLDTERVVGARTQFCIVALRRR